MSRRKLLINLHRLNDESEFMIQPSTSVVAMQSFKSELEQQKADALLRNRYLYISLNGLTGIILMIVELQLSWNGTSLLIDGRTKALRMTIFFSTLVLLCQLMDYYRLLLSHVTHGWMTKRARGFRVTPLNVLRSTTLAPLFWTEVIICLVQPIPFASGPIHVWNDPKWGLLMWLRIYMFGRLYRDFSRVYRIRQKITDKYKAKNEVPPKFNWSLSLKTLLYQRPLMTFIPFTLFIIFICSHIIYVFEREAQHQFTYAVSLYISFISMFTGWPTDTYDHYNPVTFFGRFGAIMSSVLGLFTLACLIEQFSHLTRPTPHQRPIMNYIYLLEVQERERNSAAALIQVVWKRFKWQRSHLLAANRVTFNTQEAYFCMKYIEATKNFGRDRRYKKQILSLINTEKEPEVNNTVKEAELKEAFEVERKSREALESKMKTLEEYQLYIVNQLSQIQANQQQQQQQQQQSPIPLFYRQQQQQQQTPPPYQQPPSGPGGAQPPPPPEGQ
ncbi:hypothetical protein SAMD00019534_008230, partial [Acytostelium subglobosum LB1]|uniref:hypothetical protein n=1 Tax=Acytostelium subglobosum LB1 TaxID=1410327 RepID=UPI000644E02C